MRSELLRPGAVVVLLIVAGCARMPVQSLAVGYQGPASEAAFWAGLFGQPAVSNHDTLLGLTLVAQALEPDSGADAALPGVGDDPAAQFAGLVAFAKQRRWLDPDADLQPDVTARFGLVAVAACDLMDLRDSINLRLFPDSPRYCTRELFFRRVTALRTPAQALSGPELVAVLQRVQSRSPATETAP